MSSLLMVSQVASAALGFVFWVLAARMFSTTAVGVGSSLVAGMMLLGAIGMVGLGTLLVRTFPDEPGHEIGMISAASLVAGVLGVILALAFVVVAPLLTSDYRGLVDSPQAAVPFAAGVASFGIATVVDEALIGMLQSRLVLVRNIVAATIRLMVLGGVALLGLTTSLDILLAWVVANVLSLAGLVALLARAGRVGELARPAWQVLGRLRMSALQHHLLNLAIQVPGWIMPLVAVTMISAGSNAAFYVVWMLVGLTAFIPASLMWGLYAEGSRDPDALWRHARQTLRWSAMAATASIAGLWIAGPVVLGAFGGHYVDEGRVPLMILALAVVPMVVKGHYVAAQRVRRRLPPAIAAVAFGAVLELAGAIGGAAVGQLVGLSVGITVAMYLETLVMIRTVARAAEETPATGRLADGAI